MPSADVLPLPAARRRRARLAPLSAPRPVERADRRLVAGLHRQDHAATRALYERHAAATLGFLTRALRDRTTAEDVLQEVFLDVWRRGATFDPDRGTLLGWILGIARNRAVDHLRRRVPEPVDPDRAVEVGALDAELDALQAEWRLAALLGRLPREEARLLALRFRDGLSQSEIAERTGVPLGTVKLRMVRALDRLRVLIEREEGRA